MNGKTRAAVFVIPVAGHSPDLAQLYIIHISRCLCYINFHSKAILFKLTNYFIVFYTDAAAILLYI